MTDDEQIAFLQKKFFTPAAALRGIPMTGYVADCGPSYLDPDDFHTRENADGSLEIWMEDVEITDGKRAGQWEDGDDWLLSYGIRLENGSVVSALQREIDATPHPLARAQMEMAL